MLAEKAGISVPFMTQIELGRKSASLEVVAKIASALGVDYGVLFFSDSHGAVNKSIPYSIKICETMILEDVKEIVTKRFIDLEKSL